MAISDQERLLDAWAAAWCSHDPEKVASLFVDDCIYEDVTLGAVNRGKEELKAFANLFFGAAPDLRVDLASRFVAGNYGGMEWTLSGTHMGDIPGMPATGRQFAFRGSTVVEFENDKLKRNSDYWDMVTFMKQLGFMPSE